MNSTQPIVRVLLVEDSSDDADLIQESLGDATEAQFEVQRVDRLEQAQSQLTDREFDIVLLDLGLPDSSGLETVGTALEWGTGLPIVVLTGLAEEFVGTQAVALGAQAYLVKRMESFDILPVNVLSALERHRGQHADEPSEPSDPGDLDEPDDPGGLLGRLQRILKVS